MILASLRQNYRFLPSLSLTLSVTSVTISVSVLLWFLTDFINLLQKIEEEDTPSGRKALETSTRVAVIGIGIILVLFAGFLAGTVAWSSLTTLHVPLWSSGFYLLFFSILLPVVGAIAAALILWENLGLRNIRDAFINFVSRLRGQPILKLKEAIAVDIIEKPTHQLFSDSAPIYQQWDIVLEWVEKNEIRFGLGKGFTKDTENRQVLISLVDKAWGHTQSEGRSADQVPHVIEPTLKAALESLDASRAVILNRPLSIAKAACALYVRTLQGENAHVSLH